VNKELEMSWINVESNWKQFKDKVKAQWANFGKDRRDAGEPVELTDMLQGVSPIWGDSTMEDFPSRRMVLRGALALGCSLFVPLSLSGCGSKKVADNSSAEPVSPPATSTASPAPAIPGKLQQASIQYQAQLNGDQKCAQCMRFIAESDTCKLVEG